MNADLTNIGVGALSTLGGHNIFALKICIKNQQNARSLHDSCPKNYHNTLIFYYICPKNLQNPEFYIIFARKMPDFYIIIAQKIFLGGACVPLPPSPTPMLTNVHLDEAGISVHFMQLHD